MTRCETKEEKLRLDMLSLIRRLASSTPEELPGLQRRAQAILMYFDKKMR